MHVQLYTVERVGVTLWRQLGLFGIWTSIEEEDMLLRCNKEKDNKPGPKNEIANNAINRIINFKKPKYISEEKT